MNLRRAFRARAARVGVSILAVLILIAVFGPILISTDPNAVDITTRLAPPGPGHPLGTDALGRDVLVRLIYGARASLSIAAAAVILATLVGHMVGVTSGYVGGTLDLVVARLIDLLFAIPGLLIAIAIVAALGPSLTGTVLAIGIAECPAYARIIRASVVTERDRQYVEASRIAGASGWRILRQDILPGILPVSLVQSSALVGSALLSEAALGFLGLGVQAPTASWGSMLANSREVLFYAPFQALVPGIAVVVAVLAANLVGDALTAASDPRLVQRGTHD